ncbi:MAG: hypothetical protein K2N78_07835 [Oscillospiraceae bacterium]|nr:hypothetical protein [Oscillospiraceae bacterium]
MNVRKSVDYSAMFAALDTLMAADLPQTKLYCEIGRLVSNRPEKGAAVAAAEYLCNAYPDASGFSPRNLRRMREFYRTYESVPAVLDKAMTIGWTQNVVILEAELAVQERLWYIRAVRQYGWSKGLLPVHPGEFPSTWWTMYAILKKTCWSGKAVRKMSEHSLRTNVVTGSALLTLSENVRSWQKRDCYQDLERFIHGPAVLVGKYVLYQGKNIDAEDGILYRNAEEFLNSK